MKRMTALAGLLLAALLAIACVLPWGLPSEQAETAPAEPADGTILAAENRRFTSRIYTLRDGAISGMYEEFRLRDGQESRIARVTADGDEVFFLRTLDGGDWELAQLEDGRAEALCRYTPENAGTVTGLRAEGETVWITAVGENQAIFVYRWTEAEGTALELLIPAWWLWNTVTAEYDGTVIRATTGYGDHCFLTPTGGCTYSDDAAETPGPALTTSGMGWLLCKRTVLLSALLAWVLTAGTLLAASALSRRAARLATRLTILSGAALLLSLLAALAVAVFSMSADLTHMWRVTRRTGLVLLVLWGCAVVLLRFAAGRITAPAAALAAQMDRVADGDTTPHEPSEGRDELSQMERSLQLLCMNLSVMAYETSGTIRSYRRFVPERMAQLLERPVVEEIRLGDSRRVSGNVGIFSIGNRAEARNSLEDAAFVDFINHSFGVFHDSVTENHGCMVSSGLRLSSMEALFPDSAADGVRAGLDFLGRLRPRDTGAIPTPRGCLLLHKGSFLYGIAGREERLFPYLSSSELDFLGGFLPQLDQAGVRITVTEACWSQLEGFGFTGRYIGFVSGGERLGSYKLYEILDAYPQLERELRKGYDARFQEALNLFYRNDFYLARNLFSSLLRACPDDGIVRWYLFACEQLFHQEGTAAPDYRLFGLKG